MDAMSSPEINADAANPETELRGLVALLLDAISADSLTSPGARADLASIRRNVAAASREDLSEAATTLAAVLPRWREEIEQRLGALFPANGTRHLIAAKPGIDPCTGLPGRGEAEKAIRNKLGGGRPFWAVILILQRLPAINARFGRKVGDQLLITEARQLEKQFGEHDRLFRWIGPSFIALLDRSGPPETVRSEVNHLCLSQFHANLVLDSRTVLIPLSIRWHLLASADYHSPTEFIGTLQTLVSDAEAAPPTVSPEPPAAPPQASASAPGD